MQEVTNNTAPLIEGGTGPKGGGSSKVLKPDKYIEYL